MPQSGLFCQTGTTRERLLAVAEMIEREQGYFWYFAGDEERGLI